MQADCTHTGTAEAESGRVQFDFSVQSPNGGSTPTMIGSSGYGLLLTSIPIDAPAETATVKATVEIAEAFATQDEAFALDSERDTFVMAFLIVESSGCGGCGYATSHMIASSENDEREPYPRTIELTVPLEDRFDDGIVPAGDLTITVEIDGYAWLGSSDLILTQAPTPSGGRAHAFVDAVVSRISLDAA